uniref:Uncharacterized protein n=1 Tax=Arundo donax TaxID=35708 RepID=A0A0A8ZL18_ARUDO
MSHKDSDPYYMENISYFREPQLVHLSNSTEGIAVISELKCFTKLIVNNHAFAA